MLLAIVTADQIIAATTFAVGIASAFIIHRLLLAAGTRTRTREATTRIIARILATVIIAVAVSQP